MKRYVTLAVLILVLTVFFTLTPTYSEEYRFDSGPLTIMLINALSEMYVGNYESVISTADAALNVKVPQDLSYQHVKVWSLIKELNILLNTSANGLNVTTELIYRVYRLKMEAESLIPTYGRGLVSRVVNPQTRAELSKAMEQSLSGLSLKLERLINEALKRVNTTSLRVVLESVDEVWAGETIPLSVYLPQEIYVENVHILLKTSAAVVNASTISVGKHVDKLTINVTLPSTESRIYSDVENRLTVEVALTGSLNGLEFYAIVKKPILVKAEKPPINFRMPSSIKPGSNLSLTIESEAEVPLTIKVEVLKAGGEFTNVSETLTVFAGVRTYVLNTSALEEGNYALVAEVLPKGRYLPLKNVLTFTISGLTPKVFVGLPQVVVGPPFTAPLYLRLGRELNESRVVVRSGVRVLLEARVSSNTLNSINIPLDGVFLAGLSSVTVEVIPSDPQYSTASISLSVYSINFVTALTLLTTSLLLINASTQGLITYFEGVSKTLRGLGLRGGGLVVESFTTMYRSLIAFLSRYVEPPTISETLREYYFRASKTLGAVSSSLWRFILVYEQYLYSRSKPELRNLKKAYEEILRWFK
ncbi:MAG: hypothetical protein B7O98_00035 [Zestosphaera tikiterensis]|uniref:DUF4129 domain-containing protein n=1 Tax=Zestosphaera tikiterensis TaxID=1973259 RepID=A0A2R7Y8H8_9CREN|nr:MAG: hypothetical protein B7O98_00035 [Zestosphaera tikiterensis]